MTKVAALVLAAGRATRFGSAADTSKVLAVFEGRPLVRRVADAALASRVGEVAVVTGQAADHVGAALTGLALRLVHNPDYATGMASSLRAGLAGLEPDTDGVLVLLADMPLVTAAILDRLIARFEAEGTGVDAIVPTAQGRPGNPVLLGRSLFAAVRGLAGDEGARRLLDAPGRRVLAQVIDDDAILRDVDTVTALETLAAAGRRDLDLSSA